MRRQRDDAEPRLVEVELVEEPGPLAELAADYDRRFGRAASEPEPAGPAVGSSDAPRGRRVRRGARLRVLGISVAASLVVVTVGVNLVVSQRESARRVEFAQHPWILPTLDGPPREVWQAEAPGLVAESEGLIVTAEEIGTSEVLALYTGTGEVAWSWAGDAPRERCSGVWEGPSGTLPGALDLGPDLLVCVPLGNYFRDHRPPEPGFAVTMTVLHPATGEVLATPQIDGTPLTWDLVGGDLLVSYVTHDAAVGIERWDIGVHGRVWAYRSVPGVMPQGLFGQWEHSVQDGALQVVTDEAAFAVSVATGEEVSGTPVPSEEMRAALPDGSAVEWTYDRRLFDGAGRVLAPDGTPRFEFDGIPWLALRSDGSVPDVLVVQRDGSGGLVGLDAVTGAERWAIETSQRMTPVLQIDGVAVGVVGETAIAIDLARGSRLWRTGIAPTPRAAVLTDGDVVILPVREGRETSLVGLELRAGVEVWRIPVRSNVLELHPAIDGTVLLLTPNRIIAYR